MEYLGPVAGDPFSPPNGRAMRTRSVARWTAAAVGFLVAGSLALPGLAAAATPTYGFSQSSPTPSTVSYSDLVTFHGAYTCLNGPDVASYCPTGSQTQVATFALRPSGGAAFTTVATVSTVFVFASTSAGCATTCSRAFQVQWKAGRAGSTTVPPGTYDVRLTTTLTADEAVLLGGLVITTEGTTTTYTGSTTGDEGTALALSATVADVDRGLAAGSGIWLPDVNLGASTDVTFALYDATNTTLVAGPVSASVSALGAAGPASLTLPAAGTYALRTTYGGNAFYTTSADLDTVTANPVNTAPTLVVPGPLTAEATSASGAPVSYAVSATDAEDDPDPLPACDWPSGTTFPLGTTTVQCSVTDGGGLGAAGSFTVTVVDTTAPSVTVATAEAAAASGWYNAGSNDAVAGVTVDVTASDAVGVADVSCTDNGWPLAGLGPGGGSVVIGDGQHAIACTAVDAAANAGQAGGSFDVDQTAPTALAFDGGGLVEGAAYDFGSVPVGPTGCSADYGVSGAGDCLVGGYSALVGTQVVAATATDAAGNVALAELHYTVLPWTLVGFAKPIDMTGVNTEKAGHQVALKFQVFAGSTELTTPDVMASFTETQVSCSTGEVVADPTPATSPGGLAYANAGKFVLGWLSPSRPGTCWVVTVTTLDGSSLSATFRLR